MMRSRLALVVLIVVLGSGCEPGQISGDDFSSVDDPAQSSDPGDPLSTDPDGTSNPFPTNPSEPEPAPKDTRPVIEVSSPERGATLDGDKMVTVQGKVTVEDGTIASLTINGDAVTPGAGGDFSTTINSRQGMNMIVIEATDSNGGAEKAVRSYYYSTEWTRTDFDSPVSSMVQKSLIAYLGQHIFDNEALEDENDLAAAVLRALSEMDLSAVIPSDHRVDDVAGCDYATIVISQVQHGDLQLDIDVTTEGLSLAVKIPDFKARITAELEGDWYNPACAMGVEGWVKSSPILAEVEVRTWIDQSGELQAESSQVDVTLQNFDIDISGAWGFLTDWLINHFENDVSQRIEEALEEECNEVVPDVLAKGFVAMSIHETYQIDPLYGDGPAAQARVQTQLGSLGLENGGVELSMNATAVAQAQNPTELLGAIGRASCLEGHQTAFSFQDTAANPLQVALKDDLVNQVLYAAHQGGLLRGQVTDAEIVSEIIGADVSDLQVEVDALLPPMITTCTADSKPALQLGDFSVLANFKLAGEPVQMQMYISLEMPVEFKVRPGQTGGQELSLVVTQPTTLEIDSTDVSQGLGAAYGLVKQRIKDTLIPMTLQGLAGQSVSFPIPEIDLTEVESSMPAGSKISLQATRIEQRDGYTVVSGAVK